jgi:hypothetical protein
MLLSFTALSSSAIALNIERYLLDPTPSKGRYADALEDQKAFFRPDP